MFWRYNYRGMFWAFFILLLCGLPGSQLPESPNQLGLDKAIHAILFAVLTVWLIIGFIKQHQFTSLQLYAVPWAVCLALGYGAMTEVLQGTVFVERSIDAMDMVANGAGALAGWGLFFLIYGNARAYVPVNEG